MTLKTSYLFFVCIFIVQVISQIPITLLNETLPLLGKISRTGSLIGTVADRALSTASRPYPSSCHACFFDFETLDAPWPAPTETIQLLIDNSTNITSTSTITVSAFETDVSIGFKRIDNAETVQLEMKVHLTYPTLYDIFHGFVRYTRFPEYPTILDQTSASPSPLCRRTQTSYLNVFAVPFVNGFEAEGSALSHFESFLQPIKKSCTDDYHDPMFPVSGASGPRIQKPASVLTITRTSFTSLLRSTTANPSPLAMPPNPVVSATTPVHRQNENETPQSDIASPKPIPSPASHSVSDSPPLLAPLPTLVPKPQSAGPQHQSSQHNINAPGDPESNSPSPAPDLPVQQPESISPSKVQPAPKLPSSQPANRPVITSLPRLTLGGSIVTVNSLSQFVIDRQTLRPGGPEIIVSGTPISLAASATHVVVAGHTIKLAKSPSPRFTLPGSIITPDRESNYVIGGQTLIPGSSISISGTVISLAPSASEVVIGRSTIRLLAASPLNLPYLTIGDQTVAANSVSQYIIDGQTLAAGSPAITVSGTPISLSPFASNVVVGGSTILLATAPSTSHALTFKGSIIFPNSASAYVIGSQTITPGAPAVTISGTPISLAPSASSIIIGGITSALIGSATALPPLTIDGTTILPNSASEYLIGKQTLIPGASAITISGTRISLAPSATALVVGSKTIPLTSGPALTTAPLLVTIGNSVITPNAASQYIIAGQTLIPGGPAITVSGTRLSLAPQASDIVVGTSTEGLGPLNLAGIGTIPPASVNGSASATGPVGFQGAATRVHGRRWIVAIFMFGWSFWGFL